MCILTKHQNQNLNVTEISTQVKRAKLETGMAAVSGLSNIFTTTERDTNSAVVEIQVASSANTETNTACPMTEAASVKTATFIQSKFLVVFSILCLHSEPVCMGNTTILYLILFHTFLESYTTLLTTILM